MLKIWVALFRWHLIIFPVSGERISRNSNHTTTSLLDKQHDYELKYERTELVRYDKRYIKFVDVRTFKYNRTCPLINGSIVSNLDIGYNMEFISQAYKFTSNEYRQFPMHFQFNFCEALNKDVMGFADFRKCGTFIGCPVEKEKNYTVCNWSPNPNRQVSPIDSQWPIHDGISSSFSFAGIICYAKLWNNRSPN